MLTDIIMSPPMQPAVSSTQSQQPLRRLQQVQPNNSIAPVTTNNKPATTVSSLSTSVALKPSSKPLKQQTTTTLAAKSIAPATTSSTHRPVKPATAVPVTPKPQSLSGLSASVRYFVGYNERVPSDSSDSQYCICRT